MPVTKLEANAHYKINGREAFAVYSPVRCERNFLSFIAAMQGPIVEIDGLKYEAVALEVYMLNRPILVGESVGLTVIPLTETNHPRLRFAHSAAA